MKINLWAFSWIQCRNYWLYLKSQIVTFLKIRHTSLIAQKSAESDLRPKTYPVHNSLWQYRFQKVNLILIKTLKSWRNPFSRLIANFRICFFMDLFCIVPSVCVLTSCNQYSQKLMDTNYKLLLFSNNFLPQLLCNL